MDPRIVGEVVEGLLKNASRTRDGGIIGVTVEETDSRVWIHVQTRGRDHEEKQRYIFDGCFTPRKRILYVSKKSL